MISKKIQSDICTRSVRLRIPRELGQAQKSLAQKKGPDFSEPRVLNQLNTKCHHHRRPLRLIHL